MTTAQVDHYSEMSAGYMRKAWAHLAEDDLLQASEKAWGAVATAVKAVAEARGVDHNGHGLLWRTIRLMVRETGDIEIRTHFGLAESLHVNFYEGWLEREEIEGFFGHVEQLLAKLEALR